MACFGYTAPSFFFTTGNVTADAAGEGGSAVGGSADGGGAGGPRPGIWACAIDGSAHARSSASKTHKEEGPRRIERVAS